jgi:hypothetical protein
MSMHMNATDGVRNGAVMAVLLVAFLSVGGCKRAPHAHFVLEPSVVSSCQQPVTTQVRWDVSALGLKYVEIQVQDLGRRPKTWMYGDAKGEARASEWAFDGYTVVLKSKNGVVLAKRTLTTTPCPGKDWL